MLLNLPPEFFREHDDVFTRLALLARTFSEAIRISGLVVTKLDGTAKGGIVLAVHEALNVPVKFIGIGEKASDLEQFDAKLFAQEVLE